MRFISVISAIISIVLILWSILTLLSNRGISVEEYATLAIPLMLGHVLLMIIFRTKMVFTKLNLLIGALLSIGFAALVVSLFEAGKDSYLTVAGYGFGYGLSLLILSIKAFRRSRKSILEESTSD